MWQEEIRVEELDSGDDSDTQGVGLNSGKKRFASDPLHFTGIDLAPARARRSYAFDDGDGDSSDDSDASEESGSSVRQIALRDKEEALVQSALGRIRRAQEKGKQEVKLNQDELDALEKRRRRMQAAATTKARKGSDSSGSGSEKKRRKERTITIPIAPAESIGRNKGKSTRVEESRPPATSPPGMLISGPDGLTYAPIGYYPVQGLTQNSPNRSPNRPRSASTQQLLGSQPPQFSYSTGQSSRHFSEGMRPTSSSSNSPRRPLPDEEGWMPGNSRRSSTSSHQSLNPFDYQITSEVPPPIPQHYLQGGRRQVSGPSDIQYSSLPRTLPAVTGYPAAARASGSSDPALRRQSSYRDELGDSASDDESDELGNGVQVFPEREIREPASRKPVAGNKRRRRSK
ncbi:hypothetical protein G7Y89_g10483 [Cudoniella acicularis]|uniref:Prenylated Rab acceptor 1 n=1 Tax=Cudoniella acicularis TaxID=354080 RepID=A0A8H4W0X1_9HELO|nr:hypothetical protein G7Y89_g10483 [Cudoniella acicularis]